MGLFPAYAGVILSFGIFKPVVIAFPRIRGGDPTQDIGTEFGFGFSPHTRG